MGKFPSWDKWLASLGENERVFPMGKFPSWDRWLVFLGKSEAVFPCESHRLFFHGLHLGKVKQFSHGNLPKLGQVAGFSWGK